MSTPMNAEAVRAASRNRKTADVALEDGSVIRLMALSAGAALRFRAEVAALKAAGGDPESLAPLLVARSWVNENNEQLMPEDEGAEVAASFGASDYNKLTAAVLGLNGLGDDAVANAVKNSEAIQTDSPPTESPTTSDTQTST